MEINFEKMQGLAPAVIQDASTGELLMLGFMNREALDLSLSTGFVTFYSRTRQTLWTKGETSGNRLQIVSAWALGSFRERGLRIRTAMPQLHRR